MIGEYFSTYGDFCRNIECRMYDFLIKLNLIENPSPLVERQKEIIAAKCKEDCEHTQEFSEWFKARGVVSL